MAMPENAPQSFPGVAKPPFSAPSQSERPNWAPTTGGGRGRKTTHWRHCTMEPAAPTDGKEVAETAIITINREGVIQSVDRGCSKMFGYTLEEMLGKNIKIIIPPPYKEQHDCYMEHYRRTGEKRIIGKTRIVEGQHKNGGIFPIRLSVSEVKVGPSSIFIGMIDKVQDKTGTLTCTLDGQIISANQEVETMFGYKPGELVGQRVNILMPPPHCHQHDQHMQAYASTGIKRVIGHIRNLPGLHKDGTVFPIALRVEEAQIGDLMVLKATIQKIDQDIEAVFTIDEDGNIVSCNRNFVLPMFGYTSDELLGRHIDTLMPNLYEDIALWKAAETLNTPPSNSTDNSDSIDEPAAKRRRLSDGRALAANLIQPHRGLQQESNSPGPAEPNNGQRNPSRAVEEFCVQGPRRVMARHKDGSEFPVNLALTAFVTGDGKKLFSGRIKRVDQSPQSSDENVGPLAAAATAAATAGGAVPAAEVSQGSPGTPRPGSSLSSTGLGRSGSSLGGSSVGEEDRGLRIGDYLVLRTVGKGTYGKVKLAQHLPTGRRVAIKILHKDEMDAAELDRSRREMEIQKQLNHPHISRLYETIETNSRLYIIMEYAAGGELLTYITRRGRLSEKQARRLFLQMLLAVDYCHQKKIIHRDIKHKNVLLDDQLNIKLIDFGLSNFMLEGTLRSTFCGTPAYAAPEMILAHRYVGPEVDVWSLGVVLYSMLMGRFPFNNVQQIISGTFDRQPGEGVPLSSQVIELIHRMLTVDPQKRITMAEIFSHPWVREGILLREHESPHQESQDTTNKFVFPLQEDPAQKQEPQHETFPNDAEAGPDDHQRTSS